MRWLTFAVAGWVITSTGSAQTVDVAYLVSGLERQRAVLIEFVNAAPDSVLGFRPTPGVRTYAEQIEHIAQSTGSIMRQLVGTEREPQAPARDRYLHDKVSLRGYVQIQFDDAIANVRRLQPASLNSEVTVFGLTKTIWGWVIGIQEHNAWTLGAVVPYLRLNGVTPPPYLPF